MSDPISAALQHSLDCNVTTRNATYTACNCGVGAAQIFYRSILARLEKAEAELDQLRKEIKLELNLGIEVVHDAVAPHLVTIAKLEKELATLQAECQRKDEALSYYAYEAILEDDGGQRARDAITNAPRGKTEERG
jgi:hypothetical protein